MYKKIDLPYNYGALEPFIDAETINIHYNKHYLNYLDKLNNLLLSINYNYDDTKESLINNIDNIPINNRDDVLYNLGGVLNHELYFTSMSNRKINIPIGTLKNKIDQQYGNFDNFKNEFIKNSNYVVGSGYTFLVVNKNDNLEIINTSNQETPYSYGLIPIMALDLWEHAYYLQYRNNRSQYIKNFFEIVDFDVINRNYEKAKYKIKKD